MGEHIFKWIREVMFLIIPGFVYSVDMLIIVQGNTDFSFFKFLEKFQDYSLYIAIIGVLISYVLGFIFDLALRGIFWITHLKKMREKFKRSILSRTNANDEADRKYHEMAVGYYTSLIMVRSLGSSILLLFSLILFPKIITCFIIPISIIFILALAIAYFLLRDQVILIEDTSPN